MQSPDVRLVTEAKLPGLLEDELPGLLEDELPGLLEDELPTALETPAAAATLSAAMGVQIGTPGTPARDEVDALVLDGSRRGSGRVIFIGDSITNGYNDQVTLKENGGRAFPTYAMLRSGGRWLLLKNAGIGGQTSTQIAARFKTDVIDAGADVAVIMAGMNDSGYGYSVSTYAANMTSMADAADKAGVRPIFCAVTPSTSGGSRTAYIARYNEWLRRYCGRRGYLFIDTFKPLADTDGSLKAAYQEDDVHPNAAGAQVLGEHVAARLADAFPSEVQPLAVSTVATDDLLAGSGLFLTAQSSGANTGVADGWTAYNGSNPGATSFSLIDVAGVVGKMQRIKPTSTPSGRIAIQRTAAAGTWTPGDRIAVSGMVATDGTDEVTVQLLFTGAATGFTSFYVFRSANQIDLGHLYWEFQIPAGTTQVTVMAGTLGATTAGLDIGQFSIKNLTTAGALI